ncbi:uncharacterized protein UHOD_11898 [Ustilago sp. UG-2017b]|nr:uncharacterized protein UHOD_11898 [Ustilago sp. UG-2017b]
MSASVKPSRVLFSSPVLLHSHIEEVCVRGLAPETQVGLSRYSATIKLRDDSGWQVARHDQYQYEGDGEVSGGDDEVDGVGDKTAVDYCLRFYLNPDRWSAMNRLRTSVSGDTTHALQ